MGSERFALCVLFEDLVLFLTASWPVLANFATSLTILGRVRLEVRPTDPLHGGASLFLPRASSGHPAVTFPCSNLFGFCSQGWQTCTQGLAWYCTINSCFLCRLQPTVLASGCGPLKSQSYLSQRNCFLQAIEG